MDTDVKAVLSAFADGERVEPVELASALGEPGAREALIDFVRLRAALADDSGPSESFAQEMRKQLDGRRRHRLPRPLRLLAAAAVVVLATFGVLDLFVLAGAAVALPLARPVAYNVLLVTAFFFALQGLAVVAFYARPISRHRSRGSFATSPASIGCRCKGGRSWTAGAGLSGDGL